MFTPPQLKYTLSHAAPDKAAEIRSVVTGALQYSPNGLFCFERSVDTTFVLPLDLDPQLQPQKLSPGVRSKILNELMDAEALRQLEYAGCINWNTSVVWQYCEADGRTWSTVDGATSLQLESGYHTAENQCAFASGVVNFQVDYAAKKLLNGASNQLFTIRRLSLASLVPMKTEEDAFSLFHAASLGFWGIHDRTHLLTQAVIHTLTDPKAQFLIYDRWSDEVSRGLPSGARPAFPQWEQARSKDNMKANPQLHLFTLANVVQRPIIVYSHPECSVGGVYLPLLWETQNGEFPCSHNPSLSNPLVLGYDVSRGHFTPLITFKGLKGPDPILLPLVKPNGQPMLIHFLSENQRKMDPHTLLSRLLSIDLFDQTKAPPTLSRSISSGFPILVAISTASELPEVMDTLVKRYESLFL